MIQVLLGDAEHDRRRGDAACAHNQLIDTGRDRRVQGEFDAFVRNAAHVGGSRVPRPAIENEPTGILKSNDGEVLVALRIITIGRRVGRSIQLLAGRPQPPDSFGYGAMGDQVFLIGS